MKIYKIYGPQGSGKTVFTRSIVPSSARVSNYDELLRALVSHDVVVFDDGMSLPTYRKIKILKEYNSFDYRMPYTKETKTYSLKDKVILFEDNIKEGSPEGFLDATLSITRN